MRMQKDGEMSEIMVYDVKFNEKNVKKCFMVIVSLPRKRDPNYNRNWYQRLEYYCDSLDNAFVWRNVNFGDFWIMKAVE